ncbi:MAG: hypothetical protein HC910_09850 [Spirulinaceae cyanobacterium SM2_1_0]|nr:hypothetical protein [Spirulinaceae cyanobacterium SM2_1_0]
MVTLFSAIASLPPQFPPRIRRCLAQAADNFRHYHALGNQKIAGTLDSPTLSSYRPDALPPSWQVTDFSQQLCQRLALPASFAAELQQQRARAEAAIAQQRRLIAAVLATTDQLATPTAACNLLTHCCGALPLPVAAVSALATAMVIVVAVDFEGEQLRDRTLWQALTAVEQAQLAAWLRQLQRFHFARFGRFPGFGQITPGQIDRNWLEHLAAQTGETPAVMAAAIARSLVIVPTQKAEAFIIHDIWGHFWQLPLTQLSSDYTILQTCHEPLRAGETAYTPDGPLSLREVLRWQSGHAVLDAAAAEQFFHAEVQQRLGLIFSHLLGEMLADAHEFKWLWQHRDRPETMPSSSLFKSSPTKLDLSLLDADFLFLQVLSPLLTANISALSESPLECELLQEWGDTSLAARASLKQAIAQLYQIFFAAYADHYQPSLVNGRGVFGQFVANLLYFQNALNQLYTNPPAGELPFQDLLLLFVGCYCAGDSYADFWDIDDVIANYFLPAWYLLTDEST